MPELPLYDEQWDSLASHLLSVGVPELMWRKGATNPGRLSGAP